ncbi:MAG: hybrid sensor histidine kinase/response regulator [Thermoleophilia bacterium]
MVDLNDAVRTVIELRSYELNVRNIRFETDLDPALPQTMADVHQLEQVLLNMINNAEQSITAADKHGVIGITTSFHEGSLWICISDNVTGMSVTTRQMVFEPYFTTKDVGKGTGLGLSICYGFIQEHGGSITVESNPGQGALFTIRLPLTKFEAGMNGSRMNSAGGSGRQVLVVDDEPAIVELLTHILSMDGHGVDIARNGVMGLQQLGRIQYDNVITDIKMPELDGRELHRRIKEIDPALAANVIFMTGDTVSRDTHEFLRETGNSYLVKPFNLHELRERLNKVMNANG